MSLTASLEPAELWQMSSSPGTLSSVDVVVSIVLLRGTESLWGEGGKESKACDF